MPSVDGLRKRLVLTCQLPVFLLKWKSILVEFIVVSSSVYFQVQQMFCTTRFKQGNQLNLTINNSNSARLTLGNHVGKRKK